MALPTHCTNFSSNQKDDSTKIHLPCKVKLVEVGPRDGLQNETQIIDTETKIQFINLLSETGLSVIEATSFVSSHLVPQMADHGEVMKGIIKKKGVNYPVLTANLHYFKEALISGASQVCVFTSASEMFCKKNINCTINESIERYIEILEAAKREKISVRGYISCSFGCPYQGSVSMETVLELSQRLLQLGCQEISIADTIGVAKPDTTNKLLSLLIDNGIPEGKIAVHFHDTQGYAMDNILVALKKGIAIVDSSVGGLGGCPFAKSTTGNVATEKVLDMLNGLDIETGVDMNKLMLAKEFILKALVKDQPSTTSI